LAADLHGWPRELHFMHHVRVCRALRDGGEHPAGVTFFALSRDACRPIAIYLTFGLDFFERSLWRMGSRWVGISVRRDIVDLAAGGADIQQLPVIEAGQGLLCPSTLAPFLKRDPKSLEKSDGFDRCEGPWQSGCVGGRAHRGSSARWSTGTRLPQRDWTHLIFGLHFPYRRLILAGRSLRAPGGSRASLGNGAVRYFFEECALDTDRRELRRGPDIVPTAPQVLDLLEYLIRSRDRVVSKDDLINAIWNGRIVSDAALTTRLNAVRRAIGDSGGQQRLIKTFPRKGFRFVGAVRDEDQRPGAAVVSDARTEMSKIAGAMGEAAVSVPNPSETGLGKRRSDRWLGHFRGRLKFVGGALASVVVTGAIAGHWNVWKLIRTDVVREAQEIRGQPTARPEIAPRLSLVVLPFANLNSDPEQDYFADAITTDLTADLARTTATFVVGRETAFTYKNKSIDLKQLGTDLGIRWAVRGAVRRNGDQVRVNVSLTDLQSTREIWSDRFDGDRTNLAVLQVNITARLLCVVHLHLRQYEEAIEQCSHSLNMIGANFHAYISLMSTGQMEKAREGNSTAARGTS
jgi:TolB-like protein/DNA-binding winged helix-turn-helix (wHTH) protein